MLPPPPFSWSSLFLGKEDDKDDEENGENEKDLDHQPTVRGDRLEVFEDFCVSGLNVQLCVFHIGIDPERRGEKEGRHDCQFAFLLFLRKMDEFIKYTALNTDVLVFCDDTLRVGKVVVAQRRLS